ncbi:LPXTG cell wall anchor domain-containing protein [Sphingobacterium suaedae]|uniref:LPXTG cell wall anchor domain-containing protein n=1 Tax=Sphingobacterium suaedae TaxID=1686402 RepID=A0ABW5KER6_9SPHI
MKPKTILFGIITALVAVVLFNNKEEAGFWLFGEIRTSKLLILGIFFLLGVITGGLVFRRKRNHPKEYSVNNSTVDMSTEEQLQRPSPYDHLSDEDRRFLGKD